MGPICEIALFPISLPAHLNAVCPLGSDLIAALSLSFPLLPGRLSLYLLLRLEEDRGGSGQGQHASQEENLQ